MVWHPVPTPSGTPFKRKRRVSAAAPLKKLFSLLRDYLTDVEKTRDVRRSRAGEIVQRMQGFNRTPLSSLGPHLFDTFAEACRLDGAGPATIVHNLATIRDEPISVGGRGSGPQADAAPRQDRSPHIRVVAWPAYSLILPRECSSF